MKAPPRRNVPPDGFDVLGGFEHLGAALDGTWSGHGQHAFASQLDAVAKFHDSTFGAEASAGQFVGRADAVDVHHAGQQFKLA